MDNIKEQGLFCVCKKKKKMTSKLFFNVINDFKIVFFPEEKNYY